MIQFDEESRFPKKFPLIRIDACKYDDTIHRSWNAQLIAETNEMWQLFGVFEKEITHPLLGVIRPLTASFEYYWKHQSYNVFRFHEPDGSFRNYYCNINLPPVLADGVLRYVDLDIDVLVNGRLEYQVVDMDEFAENSVRLAYPPEVQTAALENLEKLLRLIETRQFPFDRK